MKTDHPDQTVERSVRPPVRSDLESLEGYHSPQVDVDVRLNTNEAPGPPPPAFTAALTEQLETISWHRYPDRAAADLRVGVGAMHDVPADQVFCANGSNEVLQTVLLTFGGAGRRILTFEPTYALHSHLGRITGAEPIRAERGGDFLVDVDRVGFLLDEHQPSVTFLCSPNNPTGLVEPRASVEVVLEDVAARGGLLVVDEAYGQFTPQSAIDLVADDVPLVVTRTYSKTWAMAGARLGYLLGPSWLVAELEKVVLPYHLDAFKQAAGLTALRFVDEMESRVAEIVDERERVQAELMTLGCHVWPSGANFILFRPKPDEPGAAADGDRVWAGLVERSVLVRNTSSWRHLDGCLRVTVGTRSDNDRFLDALGSVLSGPV